MLDRTRSATELVAARRHIMAIYDGSETQLDQLLAVEAAILVAPHGASEDREAKRSIMHDEGEPDWEDLFIRRLALSLC